MKYVIKSREKFQSFWLTQGEPNAASAQSWTMDKDNKYILRFNSEEDALHALNILGFPTEEGKDKYFAYVQPDTKFVIKKIKDGVMHWYTCSKDGSKFDYHWSDKITPWLNAFVDIKLAEGILKEMWNSEGAYIEQFHDEVPPVPKKQPKKRTVISYTITNHNDIDGAHEASNSIAYVCTKESSLKRRYLEISREFLKAAGEDFSAYDNEARFKDFLDRGFETISSEHVNLYIIKSDLK